MIEQAAIDATYELGRLYYETGFLAQAERIFGGLHVVDPGFVPPLIGLGLVRIERGQFGDALTCFREAAKQGRYGVEAKIGLCLAFLAGGELRRASTLLLDLAREATSSSVHPDLQRLWQALSQRCNL